jgi:3',5'-cyclic-AMP phosphodiesterase
MNRKKFLQNASLLALGGPVASSAALARDNEPRAKKEDLLVAFLSDVHVKPDETAEAGMRKAFRHINSLKQIPHFIINGGDAIMDAMAADKQKTQAQWDVWNRVLNAENRLPVYHVIGNHDAWGWQVKDETIKSDPLYNKGWAVKQHGMPGRYYSFEQKGWKFLVLDSAHENNGGYISKIDEEQYAWLEQELKKTPQDQHICVASHIPIVSFCAAMFFDDPLPNGDWKLSRALLHTDARKLTQLFAQYKNIRCCLSGHIHLQDVVEYKGIRYFCNGAVSGNWWKGAFKGFEPAYAIFKFFKDGSVEREMVQYG